MEKSLHKHECTKTSGTGTAALDTAKTNIAI